MNYDDLRRIYRLEKNTSKLVRVEKNFFSELKEFIENERKSYLESLKEGEFSKAKDFINLKKLVQEILSLREKKLLNTALISSRTNEFFDSNLTDEELKTLKKIVQILEEHKAAFNQIFSEQKKPEKKTQGKDLNKVSLRILKEVPSFIGIDMKEYGPFSAEQTIELPLKTAELLVERKLAERI